MSDDKKNMDFTDPEESFKRRNQPKDSKFDIPQDDSGRQEGENNGQMHVTETDGKFVNRAAKVIGIAAGLGLLTWAGITYYQHNKNEELTTNLVKESSKAASAEYNKNQALKKAEEEAMLAFRADSMRRADSLSNLQRLEKKDIEVKQEREKRIAATENAQITERETILSLKAFYETKYSGFNVLIDYVVDGPRSFHAAQLPWKASMTNAGFKEYINNPSRNIQDYLKIKALGDSSYVPRRSIDSFFDEKYDTYAGDILGQDVRILYKVNANDGKVYGVKLDDKKVIGLDELTRAEVKYTGPTRKEITERIGKINIPAGWRKMQSYQKNNTRED